jgi:glucokinase
MGLFVGLDFGGTNLKYGVGDRNGNIIAKKIRPSQAQESADKIFENFFIAISELQQEVDDEINGIGIGTPGSIDFYRGQLIGKTPNIPHWTDAPIKKTLEQELNVPVWVDNDANVMALAEARVGVAKGYSYALCLTLGTGIGGGIILDNKVYRGSTFSAAEVGHITIQMDGKQCNCGNIGCLEVYASAPAMIDRYRHKLKRTGLLYNDDQLTTEFIFQKAAVNEYFAIETINETCDYLGAGITSLVNVLNPQIIVIGGGVANAGEAFIKRIEDVIRQRGMKANSQHLKVVRAQLGNDAGVVGAIMLAAEYYNE